MNELFRFVSIRPPRTVCDEPSKTKKEAAKEAAAGEAAKRREKYEKERARKEALAQALREAAEKERKQREEKLADLRESRTKMARLHAQLKSAAADEQDGYDLDSLEEEAEPSQEARSKRKAKLKELAESARTRTKEIRARLQEIGGAAKEVLAEAGLELDEDTFPETISTLDDRIAVLDDAPQVPSEQSGATRYAFYQGHMIASGGRTASEAPGAPPRQNRIDDTLQVEFRASIAQPRHMPTFNPPNVHNLPPAVPESAGYARVLGVGDLMVVREEPKSYELGEIAHIENILAGEFKDRSHRRTQKTEETISTFTERETENERDLQSTERLQLTQEASEIIKFDSKLEAGFNLSASYGPTVSVGANTSTSLALSAEKSKKSASDFSREVTERAKNRVIEKVREERTRKTTEEIEEINKHGFDNRGYDKHVVGLYRWVDKIQRARLLNYGTRLMLEFVIPEPAAFFMQALVNAPPTGITIEEPDDRILTLRPDQIRDSAGHQNDYRSLARLYRVSNIEPPPAKHIQIADNVSHEQVNNITSRTSSKKITITDGYDARTVVFTRSKARQSNQEPTIHVSAASSAGKITGHKRVFELPSLRGELPISISVWEKYAVSVHVAVYCRRTDEATTAWQIKTYKALLEGYQNLKSQFDEQVTVAGIRQANQIQGFAPERNRAIERNEIKRNVISMLTGQHFDMFGSIINLGGFPEIDFDQAIPEGKYVQFFENAFEWGNMSYIFYPYFWGRKQTWVEKIGLDNTDPTHLAFLQAGAARVVTPVRPGYEPVVIHYLDTGEIWAGEDVPDLRGVSAPYVDIATEIREQQGNPIDEPIIVDEWDVRLPTSLVMLQADAVLPVFITDDVVG